MLPGLPDLGEGQSSNGIANRYPQRSPSLLLSPPHRQPRDLAPNDSAAVQQSQRHNPVNQDDPGHTCLVPDMLSMHLIPHYEPRTVEARQKNEALDVNTICAQLLKHLQVPESFKELVYLQGSQAQEMMDLLQKVRLVLLGFTSRSSGMLLW